MFEDIAYLVSIIVAVALTLALAGYFDRLRQV